MAGQYARLSLGQIGKNKQNEHASADALESCDEILP